MKRPEFRRGVAISPAQARLFDAVVNHSEHDRKKPGSEGWIEFWDAADDWGSYMPLQFVPAAASRTMAALLRSGLVEEHPTEQGLVRPQEDLK